MIETSKLTPTTAWPCHANYDDADTPCCGLFICEKDDKLVCNECGIDIVDVMEKLRNVPAEKVVVERFISMSEESLPPEYFDELEGIITVLRQNRKAL